MIISSKNNYEYCTVFACDGSFAMRFGLKLKNGLISAECSLTDFFAKEKVECIDTTLLMKADYRENVDGVYYKASYCVYTIESDGKSAHFHCKFDKSFSHTEIEADLIFQCDNSTAGDCRIIAPMGGYVKTHGKVYALNSAENTGFKVTGKGADKYDDGYCLCCAGIKNKDSFGVFVDRNGECTAVLCGIAAAAGKAELIHPESVMGKWLVASADERVKLEAVPFFNDRKVKSAFSRSVSENRLYAKINGTVKMNDGTVINVENCFGILNA